MLVSRGGEDVKKLGGWVAKTFWYRSGTVNSKSFVGKVLLQIKQKFELTYACNSNFHQNFKLEISLN